MNKKSNRNVKFSISVLLVMLLIGLTAGAANAQSQASVRVYGEDDIGPGTSPLGAPNPFFGPEIYSIYKDPFDPTVIQKDSVTVNPAVVLDRSLICGVSQPSYLPGTTPAVCSMSADGLDADVKKFLRFWYEPDHVYTGILDNPTTHPTIELESTYMLIDDKHKLPISGEASGGPAGGTTFAFPVYIKSGSCTPSDPSNCGLGNLDVVNLNAVGSDSAPPTTDGAVQIQKMYMMNPGDVVQFLDHQLKFIGIFTDPMYSGHKVAKVEISYTGNLIPDSAQIYDLNGQTFFNRHDFAVVSGNSVITGSNALHPDGTWYAQLVAYNTQGQAQIIVGKELEAGDTFYVNSVRYDVPAVFVVDNNPNNPGVDELKYITLRTPLPKGGNVPLEASVVSSQWITEILPNTTIPVDPPFNSAYKMIDDVNVVLWAPSEHIDQWPIGDNSSTGVYGVTYFPEGERYLTNRSPNSSWINYFLASQIQVPDTEGNLHWIADEVNGRILDATKLDMRYISETIEPRYTTDLLEILNESCRFVTVECDTPSSIEDWTQYYILTRPDHYTEFLLPPRPKAVAPGNSLSGIPASRTDLSDAYNGNYLVTTSFYAPDSVDHTDLLDPFETNLPYNPGRAAFVFDPNNGLDIYVNRLTDPVVRIYGEDDVGTEDAATIPNTVNNPGSVGIYSNYSDPFNPGAIVKDSITFNPAIILWNGTLFPMSANSHNIDVKKFLRMWYEPWHIYDGWLVNPTGHPTIELESTYMLVDSKHKLPITGSANQTTFAFPIAEKDGQIGVGSFDGNIPKDGADDMVDLALVSGRGTQGTIQIQHTYNMNIGDQVQFLDHKLKFIGVFEDPNNNSIHYAKVQVTYAGNLADDTPVTSDLGSLVNDPKAQTWFDRHDLMHDHSSHNDFPAHPDITFYAKLEYYSIGCTISGGACSAQITVGKELSAGDTYYVNSVRNDVRAVFVPLPYQFKYITISTPLPKCPDPATCDTPLEASTVTSQWISEIPPNTVIPVNPPFNGNYNMVEDVDVNVVPFGPYPALIDPVTGITPRIERNVSALNFSYVNEAFERRYSTDLLEILNEGCAATRHTPATKDELCRESWNWFDVQTRPDEYTEFNLPDRPNTVSVEGDYLVTLSWFANNSIATAITDPPGHNLFDVDTGMPRAAFAYDPVEGPNSTGIYVNEQVTLPPTPPPQQPVAVFSVNSPVNALDTVTADPTGTFDPNGLPMTLSWNWDDGTIVNTTSLAKVTHHYAVHRVYHVTLTVTDNAPGVNGTSRDVTVLNDGVMLSFQQGWNQISIPITPSGLCPGPACIGALLASVPGYSQAWAWNAGTQSYVPAGGNAPVAGQGYFVYANAPANLVITGTGVDLTYTQVQGNLSSGWNMVGPGFINPINLPTYQFAWHWDGSYEFTQTLVPGKGYWLSG